MERLNVNQELVKHWESNLGDVLKDIEVQIHEKGIENAASAPHEYRIGKTITPKELEDIASLPFEVLITQHKAGLTLITGTKHSALDGQKDPHTFLRTINQSRFTVHNHPNSFVGVPSTSDLGTSQRSVSEIDFILALDGLTVHKSRRWNDEINASLSRLRIVARLRGGEHAVQYDKKKGYIDVLIPWNDPRIQFVCEYINGEAPWKDYEERVLNER